MLKSMYQIRRPIEESDSGANDGITVATHVVRLWLENEPRILDEARREIAKGIPLVAFVGDILYPPDGVDYLRPAERATAEALRAELKDAEGGFHGVDWLFVAWDIRED